MIFEETKLKGCWVISPKVYEDPRGYFMETFKEEAFLMTIGKVQFVQENETLSNYGVIRGMHFQKGDSAQAKLVRVVHGEILDVVIDLRKDSPTYKQQFSIRLSAENRQQLFIPKGFAHGFAVQSKTAKVLYKVDALYQPKNEGGISPLDPAFSIDWEIDPNDQHILPRDLQWPLID